MRGCAAKRESVVDAAPAWRVGEGRASPWFGSETACADQTSGLTHGYDDLPRSLTCCNT